MYLASPLTKLILFSCLQLSVFAQANEIWPQPDEVEEIQITLYQTTSTVRNHPLLLAVSAVASNTHTGVNLKLDGIMDNQLQLRTYLFHSEGESTLDFRALWQMTESFRYVIRASNDSYRSDFRLGAEYLF